MNTNSNGGYQPPYYQFKDQYNVLGFNQAVSLSEIEITYKELFATALGNEPKRIELRNAYNILRGRSNDNGDSKKHEESFVDLLTLQNQQKIQEILGKEYAELWLRALGTVSSADGNDKIIKQILAVPDKQKMELLRIFRTTLRSDGITPLLTPEQEKQICSEINAESIRVLEQKLSTSEQDVETYKQKIEADKKALKEILAAHEQDQQQFQRPLQIILQHKQQIIDEYKQQLLQAEQKIKELRKKAEDSKNKNLDLKEDPELNELIAKQGKKLKELQTEIEAIKEQNQGLAKEKKEMDELIAKKNKELAGYEQKIINLTPAWAGYFATDASRQKIVDELAKTHRDDVASIAEYEKKVEGLQRDLQTTVSGFYETIKNSDVKNEKAISDLKESIRKNEAEHSAIIDDLTKQVSRKAELYEDEKRLHHNTGKILEKIQLQKKILEEQYIVLSQEKANVEQEILQVKKESADINNITLLLTTARKEKEDFKKTFDAAMNQYQELQHKFEDEQKLLQEKEKSLLDKKNEIKDLEKRYKQESADLKQKLQYKEEALLNKEKEVECLKVQLSQQDEDHLSALEFIERINKTVLYDVKTELKQSQIQNESLKQKLESKENEIDELVEKHEEESDVLKQKLQFKESELLNKKSLIDSLQSKFDDLKSKDYGNYGNQSDLIRVKTELCQSKMQYISLEHNLATKENLIKDLEKQHNQEMQRLAQQKPEHERVLRLQLDDFTRQSQVRKDSVFDELLKRLYVEFPNAQSKLSNNFLIKLWEHNSIPDRVELILKTLATADFSDWNSCEFLWEILNYFLQQDCASLLEDVNEGVLPNAASDNQLDHNTSGSIRDIVVDEHSGLANLILNQNEAVWIKVITRILKQQVLISKNELPAISKALLQLSEPAFSNFFRTAPRELLGLMLFHHQLADQWQLLELVDQLKLSTDQLQLLVSKMIEVDPIFCMNFLRLRNKQNITHKLRACLNVWANKQKLINLFAEASKDEPGNPEANKLSVQSPSDSAVNTAPASAPNMITAAQPSTSQTLTNKEVPILSAIPPIVASSSLTMFASATFVQAIPNEMLQQQINMLRINAQKIAEAIVTAHKNLLRSQKSELLSEDDYAIATGTITNVLSSSNLNSGGQENKTVLDFIFDGCFFAKKDDEKYDFQKHEAKIMRDLVLNIPNVSILATDNHNLRKIALANPKVAEYFMEKLFVGLINDHRKKIVDAIPESKSVKP